MEKRILTHYQLFKLNKAFWELEDLERKQTLHNWAQHLKKSVDKVNFYQVFPSREEYDIMVWASKDAEENHIPSQFFDEFGRALNVFRKFIEPSYNLWGFTKPSTYTKAKRNPQEIDPYDDNARTSYFIVYPFTKTIAWYLESAETRWEYMQGHIKTGKQYPEIMQLLVYSFGLQDQEFVVSYETENLSHFSDLVYDLRMTEARYYTERDTPILTGIYRKPDHLAEIFS